MAFNATPLSAPIPVRRATATLEDEWSTQDTRRSHAVRSLLDRRRIWRTLGSGEAIWPRELEAALLEGLQQYQPTACKETVMLGRFPRRNQFVSQHIWKKTGQYRTAKQVGSRIQQLRESYEGPECTFTSYQWAFPIVTIRIVQELLFPVPKSPSTSHASDLIIFIDILPSGWIEQPPEAPLRPWSENHNAIHVSRYPRHLAYIDPTVTFVSTLPLFAESIFTVRMDETVVHVEQAPLTVTFEGLLNAFGVLHCAALIPGYWNTLLKCPGMPPCRSALREFHLDIEISDPTRYKIFHEVRMVHQEKLP
ncbi:hypothetical protein B0H11DRAFT_1710695 [Mycena galericulata]|nr:hypothetical protein B0H11DRAFT_1710695 [Mycena galericulata]